MSMSRKESGYLGYLKSRDKIKAYYESLNAQYNLSPKMCLLCLEAIPYKKRLNVFCGHRCAATYNNVNRSLKRRSNQSIVSVSNLKTLVKCARVECDGKTKRAFCSLKCSVAERWTKLKSAIENGSTLPTKITGKRYLIEVKGHKCEMCGLAEWLKKPIMLVLDHIDGNSENWNVVNLRLICSNCDATTSTYKGRNRGRGRFSRRMRYQQGLSF